MDVRVLAIQSSFAWQHLCGGGLHIVDYSQTHSVSLMPVNMQNSSGTDRRLLSDWHPVMFQHADPTTATVIGCDGICDLHLLGLALLAKIQHQSQPSISPYGSGWKQAGYHLVM